MANKQEPSGGATSPRILPYALGPVKDHVRLAADSIGSKFSITTVLGVGLRAGESDHPKGLALDFMIGKDMAKGGALAEYVKSNASAYGVTYVMWNKRIWSVARQAEGWRTVKNRGSNTANHMDHVHVSFSPTPGSGIPAAQSPSSSGSGMGCVMFLIAAAAGASGITEIIRMIGA